MAKGGAEVEESIEMAREGMGWGCSGLWLGSIRFVH